MFFLAGDHGPDQDIQGRSLRGGQDPEKGSRGQGQESALLGYTKYV